MMVIVIHLFRLMSTWHRRGFSSRNGVVATISINNGEVLVVVAMSRHCQGCVDINALENSNDELVKLKAEYNFSAPVMETKGTEKIFNRSKDNGIIYSGYYGDGDLKAYEKVKDVYPSVTVVLATYKRVGNRLRAYGVVVSMFDFRRGDQGSNPGRGGKISCLLHYRAAPFASV